MADAHELRALHQRNDRRAFCRFCGPAYHWPCTRRERAEQVIDQH